MTENQRVKELRNYLKLNQEEFSNSIALKQGSLSDLERGKIGISSEVLKTLIKVYRINPIWLYEGEGEMFLKLDNFYINEEKNFKLENTEKYDKSNKMENDEYHKSYHNDYHNDPKNPEKSNKMENEEGNKTGNNGYILEDNQGSDRVEEKQAQYTDKTLKHSKSEYFDFLKKEIAFKNKIIENLLQKEAMIHEDEIEKKVRQALAQSEKRPLKAVLDEVQKEVMKEVTTKEEAKLVGEIFVKILSKLFKE